MIDDPGLAATLHGALEYLGIAIGAWWYRRSRPHGAPGLLSPGPFAVAVGVLAGAAVGNKLIFLIQRPDVLQAALAGEPAGIGQTIVGGLVGGLVGVEIAKALTGQTASTGDRFVVPLTLGIGIGRIGCFIAGLSDDTYGVQTALPWGVDFGDGVPRHPTQLYDIATVAMLAAAVHGRFDAEPGLAFKLFLIGYLLWRFFVDGLKPVIIAGPLGWSGIQWTCLVAVALYAPFVWRAWRRFRQSGRSANVPVEA